MLVISVGFFGNAEIVKKCGFPVFLFLYFEQGRGGKKRRQDSGADFWFIFETWSMFFSIAFSFASVVEAAPQARPKTTAVANTALGPSPWRALDFGGKGKEKRSEIKRKEKTKTREEGKAEQSRAERRKEKTKTREERRAEQSRKKKRGKEEKRREEKRREEKRREEKRREEKRREELSLIHISEPTRRTPISYAVFCLKKKTRVFTLSQRNATY